MYETGKDAKAEHGKAQSQVGEIDWLIRMLAKNKKNVKENGIK